jgi:hypothetical protein
MVRDSVDRRRSAVFMVRVGAVWKADDSETLYAHLQHELERFTDQSLYVVMTSSKLSPIFVKVESDGCQEVGRLSLPETTLQPDEIYAVMREVFEQE